MLRGDAALFYAQVPIAIFPFCDVTAPAHATPIRTEEQPHDPLREERCAMPRTEAYPSEHEIGKEAIRSGEDVTGEPGTNELQMK